MKSPCKDCESRHEACWSNCEKYKEWRSVFDENKKARERQYEPSNFINDQKHKRIKRLNKRK